MDIKLFFESGFLGDRIHQITLNNSFETCLRNMMQMFHLPKLHNKEEDYDALILTLR